MTRIAVFVPDLMDRSRFANLGVKADITFVPSVEGLRSIEADTVVADLGRPNVIDALVQSTAQRKIGFISHVNIDQKDAATAAGIEVFNRSVFFSRVVNNLT